MLCDAAESLRRDVTAAGPPGSFGDAAVLSFNGNKIMTTSGGGMLLTDDADLADHVRKLSTQAREPVAHYEHTEIGYNYRLSNILAALGRAQLARLDDMIERRREWRERYRALVADLPGVRDPRRRRRRRGQLLAHRARRGPRASRLVGAATWRSACRPRRHRDPAAVEADAPAAGLRRPASATLDGTADRLFEHGPDPAVRLRHDRRASSDGRARDPETWQR